MVGSKIFTCIKSGNKLIWDKGNAKSTNTSNFAERWNATGSMAIKTMTKVLEQGRWTDVPKALELYRNPGTDVEAGLLRRRKREGELWQRK